MNYWKIILEVVILWYVTYMALLFVKGTRTEQLLRGLVTIGVIFIVTQQLGLETITWLLARLFPISVIALVVIFQPELRRALARLGQFGIYHENLEVIDEISRAAATLSDKHEGALIVVEREGGLKSYVESGAPVDGKVTANLLVSIFSPQSPLHDGAVIIQHGRVAAAACVLPLTQEETGYLKSLGMRHRAAVGISEETDAACVVVSEQTGRISIANDGRLIIDLDEENLRKALKGMFSSPIQKRASLLKSSLHKRA